MLSVVVHKQILGKTFAFVIETTDSNRIDITQVILRLRLYFWVAVDLTY